jgi:hypothetical protein
MGEFYGHGPWGLKGIDILGTVCYEWRSGKKGEGLFTLEFRDGWRSTNYYMDGGLGSQPVFLVTSRFYEHCLFSCRDTLDH